MTRVLFIAGVPHSGTTLVSQALDGVDGVAAVGESFYLWDAYDRGWDCGCGMALRTCPFWGAVLAEAFVSRGRVAELRPDRYYMSMRQLPRVLAGTAPPRVYADALAATLASVATTAAARVVVEASKSPTYGRILERLPGVDFRVVHVVRRPQATSHSWARFPGEAGRPVRHASLWNAWNGTVEALWSRRRDRYLRIRYEDFAISPRETLQAIVRFAGFDGVELPIADDGTATLPTTHTVAGNPVRFRAGRVPIRLDEAWRTTLPSSEARALEALTWPFRRRYGYRGATHARPQ